MVVPVGNTDGPARTRTEATATAAAPITERFMYPPLRRLSNLLCCEQRDKHVRGQIRQRFRGPGGAEGGGVLAEADAAHPGPARRLRARRGVFADDAVCRLCSQALSCGEKYVRGRLSVADILSGDGGLEERAQA